MSESTTTTCTTVIIGKGEQYEPWIHQTKATAFEHEVWEYINPQTNQSERPVLVEPLPPTIAEVVSMQEIVERRREKALARVIPTTSSSSSGGTLTPTLEVDTVSPPRLSELEAEEQMTYSMNVRLFERAIKQYDRKAAAMRKMCSRIQETVAPNY